MTRTLSAIAAALVLLLATGCTSADAPVAATQPVAASAGTPLHVVAVLDKVERNGYEDRLTDGRVLTSTLVSFTVVQPEAAWGRNIQAYCSGHPNVGGKPLLVGQAVTLTIPAADRGAVPLEELEQLARYE